MPRSPGGEEYRYVPPKKDNLAAYLFLLLLVFLCMMALVVMLSKVGGLERHMETMMMFQMQAALQPRYQPSHITRY